MRLLIQRVAKASIHINGKEYANIREGLLVFLGISDDDDEDDIFYLTSKLCHMRVFSDEHEKMNLDIKQINGELLLVSQFTLHALTKKGNRPSFIKAAKPEKAIPLYNKFILETELLLGKSIKTGVFGANMQVELLNSGPVTIILDSKNRE